MKKKIKESWEKLRHTFAKRSKDKAPLDGPPDLPFASNQSSDSSSNIPDFESSTEHTQGSYFKNLVSKTKEQFRAGLAQLKNLRSGRGLTFKSPLKGGPGGTDQFLYRLDQLKELAFAPTSRGKVHRLFLVSLALSLAFLIGKITGLTIQQFQRPQTPVVAKVHFDRPSMRQDLLKIKQDNVFKAKSDESTSKDPNRHLLANELCKESQVTSRLPIKLVNTIVLQDEVKSVASVQVRSSGELQEVRQGEKLNNLATIGKIDRLKLFLRNMETGECEYIASQDDMAQSNMRFNVLDPEKGNELMDSLRPEGIQNEGNNYSISRSLFQDKLKNPSAVLSEARAIQMTNPDGSLSFKLVEVVPGGFFSHLGITENDVITQINGKKITNISEVFNLFSSIQNLQSLNLTIERDGSVVEQNYEVKN